MFFRLAIWVLLVSAALACKSNGACGCCGCRAKAKARAATSRVNGDELVAEDDGNVFGLSIWNKTDVKPNDDNVQRLMNPNHLFHLCCEERNLPPSCVQKCHFNVYDKSVLESMFTGSDECPLDFLPEMQFCAAQGRDHRQCCRSRGVAETAAGEKCLVFCDQTPDVYTPIDYGHAPCLERFEEMKRCFYDEIRTSARKHFFSILNI